MFSSTSPRRDVFYMLNNDKMNASELCADNTEKIKNREHSYGHRLYVINYGNARTDRLENIAMPGTYRCLSNNYNGTSISKTFNVVNVTVSENITLDVSQYDQTKYIRLECGIKGVVRYEDIQWFYSRTQGAAVHKDLLGVLHIKWTKTGNYTCSVENFVHLTSLVYTPNITNGSTGYIFTTRTLTINTSTDATSTKSINTTAVPVVAPGYNDTIRTNVHVSQTYTNTDTISTNLPRPKTVPTPTITIPRYSDILSRYKGTIAITMQAYTDAEAISTNSPNTGAISTNLPPTNIVPTSTITIPRYSDILPGYEGATVTTVNAMPAYYTEAEAISTNLSNTDAMSTTLPPPNTIPTPTITKPRYPDILPGYEGTISTTINVMPTYTDAEAMSTNSPVQTHSSTIPRYPSELPDNDDTIATTINALPEYIDDVGTQRTITPTLTMPKFEVTNTMPAPIITTPTYAIQNPIFKTMQLTYTNIAPIITTPTYPQQNPLYTTWTQTYITTAPLDTTSAYTKTTLMSEYNTQTSTNPALTPTHTIHASLYTNTTATNRTKRSTHNDPIMVPKNIIRTSTNTTLTPLDATPTYIMQIATGTNMTATHTHAMTTRNNTNATYTNAMVTHINATSTYTTSIPAHTNTIPTYTNTVPTYTRSIPSNTNTIPTYTKTMPSKTNTIPRHTSAIPSPTTTMPTYTNTMSTKTNAISSTYTTSIPTHTITIPAYTNTMPTYTRSIPSNTTTIPTYTNRILSHTSAIPSPTTTMATHTNAMSTKTNAISPTYTTSIPTHSNKIPAYTNTMSTYIRSIPSNTTTIPTYTSAIPPPTTTMAAHINAMSTKANPIPSKGSTENTKITTKEPVTQPTTILVVEEKRQGAKIKATMGRIYGVVGAKVTLECVRVWKDHNVIIDWKFSNYTDIKSNHKYHFQEPDQWSLEIWNLTREDTGNYTCLIDGQLDPISAARIELIVTDQFQFTVNSATKYSESEEILFVNYHNCSTNQVNTTTTWYVNGQKSEAAPFGDRDLKYEAGCIQCDVKTTNISLFHQTCYLKLKKLTILHQPPLVQKVSNLKELDFTVIATTEPLINIDIEWDSRITDLMRKSKSETLFSGEMISAIKFELIPTGTATLQEYRGNFSCNVSTDYGQKVITTQVILSYLSSADTDTNWVVGPIITGVTVLTVCILVCIVKRKFGWFKKKIYERRLMRMAAKEFDEIGLSISNQMKSRYVSVPKSNEGFPRQRLRILEVLGEGNFGKVVKAEALDINGNGVWETVAIKMCKETATDSQKEDFAHELALVKQIPKHSNVVNYLGYCQSADQPTLMILEYISGGNLLQFLRKRRPNIKLGEDALEPLDSSDLSSFAYQIAKGLEHLSKHNIIHRDIAARNILITENNVCKVADLGLARDLHDSGAYEIASKGVLPIRWMAPESLTDGIYTSKSDVWSFGILLWEIVTLGASPYPGMSARQVMAAVVGGDKLECPDFCSKDLQSLIIQCWGNNPSQRPSFSEICQILESLLEEQTDYLNLQNYEEGLYAALFPTTDDDEDK
ncbi:uncharacterized protein LOC126821932 [Patella vulgata]|uniref:uncharacterized protein LOC126821932 n=1 Tax=Patella vulgata TaxID=6465 RepID=UPI0024A9F07D|nr:uncharacterized protein LOC126821932 [Patella vulgata]